MADFIKPVIYLIKKDITDITHIFKKDGEGLLVEQTGEAQFFYKPSPRNTPKWFDFVRNHYRVDPTMFYNASSYGVIVLTVEERLFAIPLGMGSHMIDMSKIEYNFGLKVAINCIPKNELRQLDLTTPESNSQKTKKQAVKGSTPEDFGVNKQKDILRGVVGKLPKEKIEGEDRPRPHFLGESIEGKDSVRISAKATTLEELSLMCRIVLRYSMDNQYTEVYPWIDNMAIVNDPSLVDELYDDLVTAIKGGELELMHIAPPQFIDNLYEYEGFVFKGNKKRNKEPNPFPCIQDMIDDFGDQFIQDMDRNTLAKTCKLALIGEDRKTGNSWPLSKCIQWEVSKDGIRWILSEGTWYKIDEDFHAKVENFFNEAITDDLGLPEMPSDLRKEADYNAFVSSEMDRVALFDLGCSSSSHKSICVDRNEICDLYDVDRKRFIHVKSGKSSDSVSHLLRQGSFSAYMLKREGEERNRFVQYLFTDGYPNAVPEPYDVTQYTVDFVLILGETQKQDISFFSKVSFMDTAKNLNDIGYKVAFSYALKRKAITSTNSRALNTQSRATL